MKVAAIVLAAGESRRMGAPKALLPFGETTILGAVIRALRASPVDSITVVLGFESERVRESTDLFGVNEAHNPNRERGMLSSIQTGLESIAADAYLIALGDQPQILPQTVAAVVNAARESQAGIVVPIHDGKRGHPLLIRSQHRQEILSMSDSAGLNAFVRGHPEDVLAVPVDSPTILKDIDTPEEYQAALKDSLPPDRTQESGLGLGDHLMAVDPVPQVVRDYLDSLAPPRPPKMQVMEAYAKEVGFPIIGPASGYMCYQLTRMIGAKSIFELGSGYGYSTAWFAKGVQENGGGVVHHVVWDEDLSQRARGHLAALGFDGIVEYRVGEAVQALRETPGTFDIIFNDIDKHMYPDSLPVIAEKLRPGGILIIDNMLWHGAIFDESDQSADTVGVREFTRLITTDPGWIVSLVPIRDGVIVAYKR